MHWEWIVFLAAALGISAGCLMPARWLPPLPNDKLLHFLAFGGLALLAVRIAHSFAEQAAWLLGLVVAGWAIEMLQNFVPGRKFCWRDMGANVAGISAAALFSSLITLV
jgi:VanZ family protein